MRRLVGVALWAVLLAHPVVGRAAEARLVYPPDGALLAPGEIEALGFAPGATPASLTVRGPGGAAVSVKVAGGLFQVPVTLAAGENVLALGGREVKVFAAAGTEAPAAFSSADQHAVDNSCSDCHTIKGDAIRLSEAPPALCAACHDGIGTAAGGKPHAVAHPPVEEGDCLACHTFHGLAISALPAAAKRAICFECHDDVTGGGGQRMHGPVGSGECTGCHLVHGGPERALLAATGLQLCLKCHKDPSRDDAGEEWATPHPALDDGCPTCHVPHAAAGGGLLRAGQVDLCGECHDEIVPPDDSPGVVHPPVADGECSECHNPHGSASAKLLRAVGTELCTRCHDDPAVGPDGGEWDTPHPALDDGCPTCHLPHASAQPALLRKPQAPLCFECHDTFATVDEGGKALFLHAPVARGQCAGCHAPHGSAVGKLLRKPSPELCLGCHRDPASTPEGGEWAVPHPALDDGCPACHRPHVAPVARLLEKPQAELCAGCHEDKTLNADGEPWVAPHRPVKEGRCAACHGPHGAPEAALLLRPVIELCGGCHEAPHPGHLSVELDEVGQPVVKQLVELPQKFPVRKRDGALFCTGCHLPHGSDQPRLWTAPQDIFCAGCHRF